MSLTPRQRFRNELAALCFGFGLFAGFAHPQAFAQEAVEVIPAKIIEHSALAQSVSLTAEGQLVGQVEILGSVSSRAASGMKISLLTSAGKSVEAKLDDRGGFAFSNVEPGVCSIFGQAGNVVVCQSFQVLVNDSKEISALQLFAVSPTSPEMEKVIFGSKSIATNKSISFSPSVPSASSPNGLVALSNDGTMQGHLWSVRGDVIGTSASIYQNGMIVARATADAAGKFSVKLSPGTYSLVASGAGGVAAVGFKAESSDSSVAKNRSAKNVKLVSLQDNPCASSLDVGLAPCPSVSSVEVIDQGLVVDPGVNGGFAGGGATGGGSFGGGGGGAGGLGGLGSIAAIGGLVAVGIIAADNNNDAPTVPVSQSGQ